MMNIFWMILTVYNDDFNGKTNKWIGQFWRLSKNDNVHNFFYDQINSNSLKS